MKEYLMGLDLGGSGGRCLLVNTATGQTWTAFRPWTMIPDPKAGGFAYRIDPTTLWAVLCETTRQVLQQANVQPSQVVGIATASMRHTTVVLDRSGNVLWMTPNRDARAAPQSMQLAAEQGETIYRLNGHFPSPIFLGARLLWLKENEPEIFRTMALAMSLSDWVGYRMTGEAVSEYAQAGESLLLDLKTRKWASSLLKSLGLPEKVLPPLRSAGTRLGKLTQQAAAELGLPPGLPVALGGPDTQCALLGAGVLANGTVGIVTGTTTPIQLVTNQPIFVPAMNLWTGLHVLPSLYVLESNAGQMGATLEWLARLLFPDVPNPVARLIAEAATSQPGAYGMLSTIGATIFNAVALNLPVDTLTFSTIASRPPAEARADLARAVLEGMAYAVRSNLEQVLSASGIHIERVYVTGGVSRSTLWTRLLSDVLGLPVQVSASVETTALGAAICAGVGAGLFRDLVSGAKMLKRNAQLHPPGNDSSAYQRFYANWQELTRSRQSADSVAAGQITEAMLETLPSEECSANVPPVSFRPRLYISAEVDETTLQRLGQIGEVTYKPYRTEGILLTGEDLVQTLQGYQVLITEVDIVDAGALLDLPDLRLIVVCRGNPVNIDLEACTLAGVPVINTPARNADAVADLTVALMLMLARKIQPASAFLRQPGGEAGDLGRMGQAHEEFLGIELWRKTVGLIGGGAVGRKVATRLLPFGVRLFLYDPYLSEDQVARLGAEKVSLERLLAESDFISLHAPVTEETRGMINAAAFARLKPGAFLVNTARAALVDQTALLEALRSGKLGGYAADVFPIEPPAADDPLLAFPNVIATPHIGGNTREVAAHQGEIIFEELSLLLAGRKPRHLLNPTVMESFRWSGLRQQDEVRLRQRRAAPSPGVTDLEVAARQQQVAPPSVVSQPATVLTTEESMDTNDTRQKMIAILKEFTARVATDSELAKFAKGKNVVFSFTLKDLDQSFYLAFVNGQVAAGLDAPPREPDVKLKMATDILDGMFTGRVNATKAATSGKLSFSGDTGKAMAFIRIQGQISQLYSQARQKVGDPGDLTRLNAIPTPPPPSISTATLPSERKETPAYAAPIIHKTGDVRNEILMVTSELYAKGMITATGGNVSARCEDNPNEIWITPSAIFKGNLHAEMMVRLDLNGHPVRETAYNASSERRVHCAIYRRMSEVQAVIHSHAPYATLMALTGIKFQPISTEAAFVGEIPVVPFIMPGTEELADAVAAAMQQHGIAVLMQNHGLVVVGSSLRRAADMTEIIEATAHKLITCRLLGIEPPLLPEETVKTLKEIGASIA